MTSQPSTTTNLRRFTLPRIDPILDVERSAIKRLLADYEARATEFEPGTCADAHISGAIEAIERILLMELE
jgi:hypothetical protein